VSLLTIRVRAALPWIGLAVGLAAATAPVWRLPLLGLHPTLDELLAMRCFGARVPTDMLDPDALKAASTRLPRAQ